ncbi:MAG: hypothetical protein ACREJN_21365 [Nitrospiraceae bacterium]
MPDSIQKDIQGPDWPLGVIVVATPGTPVNLMSLVDPTNLDAPQTPVSDASPQQYTVRANQIILQGYKKGASHGLQVNTGQVYITREGAGGAGNRDDYGSIVATLSPGQSMIIEASAVDNNVFSPYRYFVDADNADDAVVATLIIG